MPTYKGRPNEEGLFDLVPALFRVALPYCSAGSRTVKRKGPGAIPPKSKPSWRMSLSPRYAEIIYLLSLEEGIKSFSLFLRSFVFLFFS